MLRINFRTNQCNSNWLEICECTHPIDECLGCNGGLFWRRRRLLLLLRSRRGRHDWRCRRRWLLQSELVVHQIQFAEPVLFQAHEALQRRRLLACAAHAMDDVTLFLFTNEQNVEHFELMEWKNGSSSISFRVARIAECSMRFGV